MQMKKVVSLVMVVVMMLTAAVIPATFSAADKETAATSVNTTSDYALAPNIQSGNILHAFNWRMRDLVKYAPEIAAAGYTSVQISPVQGTKATSNDGAYATDWWSFYQPTDMKVGNALGTNAEVKAAADELHKYGVKVIADVVTNHVQNCTSKAEAALVASALSSTSTGARHSLTTHPMAASDSSREAQVRGDLDNQLPDMNTGLKSYQNYVINNLINPLSDDGIDGFRFDAAKHIETPDDGSFASDYWPTVTNAIKAKNSNAFIYGEILDNAGKFSIGSYTKYMSVTDWGFGNTVRGALNSKNASALTSYGYSGSSKNQNVLWVESHDNFCSGASTGLSKKQQILGWAAIGARKDAPALFYVRPKHEAIDSAGFIKYDDLMGAPGSATTWKDPTVVAVNKFKNAFAGQNESVTASGANLFVQRGTTGMVIVNLNGSSATISQSCSMANGSYKDQVSGTTFQVSGGKITGSVGATGVAVVYNTDASNSAPEIKLSLNNVELNPEVLSRYTDATATVKVDLKNATSASIKVSNLAAKTVTGSTTFTLNSTIPYGKSVDVTVTATNGTKTVERTYNIKKKNPNETKKVYFDNNVMKWPVEAGTAKPGIYVYCKSGTAASTQLGAYDAFKMTAVSGQSGIYSYDVPANTNYVKFNEGFIASQYSEKSKADAYGRYHLFHSFSECQGYCGRTMPETVVNYGSANTKANRENGGYALVGAMILRDLRFEDYGEYPVATLTNADTTLNGDVVGPTEAPTQPPTQPPVGKPIVRGDADMDKIVSILDVTLIQRHVADVKPLTADGVLAADVDGSKDVEITDATLIQRYLADIGNPYKVNEVFYVGGDAPTPTTAPQPTSAPQPTTAPVDPTDPPTPDTVTIYFRNDKNWSSVYAHMWNSAGATTEWPGEAATHVGGKIWSMTINTGEYDSVIFNKGGDGGQTVDVAIADIIAGGNNGVYPLNTQNDLGHYDAAFFNFDGTITDETTGGGDAVTFLLTDNFGWGSAYVYAWDAAGNALCGEWPGAAQAETQVNDYGETQFKCTVPEGAVGVILNNGNGAQTQDITDFGTYDGYWMDGSKNDLGHYIVTGWNY
ncbi:starch-binding protein [Ruminococcus sp.]|uniref:starch-binding protein n=1 Tax=Ruminococcus sp. TaxID=41978 RepID=UPI00388F1BC3